MNLFRRIRTTWYRWRLERLDHRLDALEKLRRQQSERTEARRLGSKFEALAINRALLARRLGTSDDGRAP